jgi:hypothetical protein
VSAEIGSKIKSTYTQNKSANQNFKHTKRYIAKKDSPRQQALKTNSLQMNLTNTQFLGTFPKSLGMQNGTVTSEASLAVPYRGKHIFAI